MGVKIAFLHGLLQEEVSVGKPVGFEFHDMKNHVCKLKKALYGLKQAPHARYARIDKYLINLGFTRSKDDPNLFVKTIQGMPLILVLYVNDLFMIGVDPLILECKSKLASKFEMKHHALMHYFLGLEIWKNLGNIFLSQGKYSLKLLKRFFMVDSSRDGT